MGLGSNGDKTVWEVERGSKREMERPKESDETKKDKLE